MIVALLNPNATPEHLGLIPSFLDENDERSAVQQFDANYQHGGGWMPMQKFELLKDDVLKYPGDEPLEPFAMMMFRKERIMMYPHAIVAVIQEDGSFEVARMD